MKIHECVCVCLCVCVCVCMCGILAFESVAKKLKLQSVAQSKQDAWWGKLQGGIGNGHTQTHAHTYTYTYTHRPSHVINRFEGLLARVSHFKSLWRVCVCVCVRDVTYPFIISQLHSSIISIWIYIYVVPQALIGGLQTCQNEHEY